MFKIDWPTAIGGAVLGYYAKGRVEAAKSQFKGIYTGAMKSLKESFSEDFQQDFQQDSQQATKAGQQGKKNG